MPKRTAQAGWNGPFKEGSGTMRMASGSYEGPYSAESRFEEGEGTNPEELLASAHAGCFSMALTLGLEKAGHDPKSVDTEATVHINKAGEGFAIDRIDLVTRANVPGISEEEFRQAAEAAKEGCPVSQLFKGGTAEITLDATLEA